MAELADVAAAFRGRGAVLARRAAALVRTGVDSAQETELRLCLVLAGLPEPECHPLVGTVLEAVGRVDLRYGRYRLLLEYEGDQHRTDRRQWNRDFERHEELVGGLSRACPGLLADWCALFSATARLSRLQHAFEVLERTLDGPG